MHLSNSKFIYYSVHVSLRGLYFLHVIIIISSHLRLFLFESPEPTGALTTATLTASEDDLWRTGLSLDGRIIP